MKTTGSAANIDLVPTGKVVIGDDKLSLYGKNFPSYPSTEASTYDHKYYLQLNENKELKWDEYDKTTVGNSKADASTVDYRIKSLQFSFPGGHEWSELLISDSGDTSLPIKSIGGKSLFGDADIECAKINGEKVIDSSKDFTLLDSTNTTWQALAGGGVTIEGKTGQLIGTPQFSGGKLTFSQSKDTLKFDDGNLYADGFYMSSDERNKTEIKSPEFNGELPEIRQFVYKDSSVFSYGVIAQEVEKSGLEVLVNTAEDDRKTVNYTALLCLMIDDLRKKNQALEERVAELEKHNR